MPIIDALGSAVSGLRAYMEAERAGDERVMQREYDRTNQLLDNLIKGHGVSESQERMRIARLQTQQRERLMPSEVTLQEQAVRKGELEIGAYERGIEEARELKAFISEKYGMTPEQIEASAAAGTLIEDIERQEVRTGIGAVTAEERAKREQAEAAREVAELAPEAERARIDLMKAQTDKLWRAAELGQDVDWDALRKMNDYQAAKALQQMYVEKEGITPGQAWERTKDSSEMRQTYALLSRLERSKGLLDPDNPGLSAALIAQVFSDPAERKAIFGTSKDLTTMKKNIDRSIALIKEGLLTRWGIEYDLPPPGEPLGGAMGQLREQERLDAAAKPPLTEVQKRAKGRLAERGVDVGETMSELEKIDKSRPITGLFEALLQGVIEYEEEEERRAAETVPKPIVPPELDIDKAEEILRRGL